MSRSGRIALAGLSTLCVVFALCLFAIPTIEVRADKQGCDIARIAMKAVKDVTVDCRDDADAGYGEAEAQYAWVDEQLTYAIDRFNNNRPEGLTGQQISDIQAALTSAHDWIVDGNYKVYEGQNLDTPGDYAFASGEVNESDAEYWYGQGNWANSEPLFGDAQEDYDDAGGYYTAALVKFEFAIEFYGHADADIIYANYIMDHPG